MLLLQHLNSSAPKTAEQTSVIWFAWVKLIPFLCYIVDLNVIFNTPGSENVLSSSLSSCLGSPQHPAPHPVPLDMSLQTPSDVKVKEEAPVEVDSSPPDSPDPISVKSVSSREPLLKVKVNDVGGGGVIRNRDLENYIHACIWSEEYYLLVLEMWFLTN